MSFKGVLSYGVGKLNGEFDAAAPPPDQRYWGGSEYFLDDNIKEIGCALWLDHTPFNPATPLTNYWTPSAFAAATDAVMDGCHWLWIYNPDWGFYNGRLGTIPSDYNTLINAERIARGLRP